MLGLVRGKLRVVSGYIGLGHIDSRAYRFKGTSV